MGFYSNGPVLNFIPNLANSCGMSGGGVNFYMPSGINMSSSNPLFNLNFMSLPAICGDTIGLDAGLGFPNYLNGTFMPFNKGMALPILNQLFNRGCQCGGGFNPIGNFNGGQGDLLNTLVQLVAMKEMLTDLQSVLNTEGKTKTRIIEPKLVDDEAPIDEKDESDTKKENNGIPKKVTTSKKSNIQKNGVPVKLTDDLRSKRESIINGVKNTWYGTRNQWSETSAISKMEELNDDEFITMFTDEEYADIMAEHLCSGSNADGVMAYIIKRLQGLAPKDVKIYADNEWADSFVVSKSDIRPGYSHELQYCENIMDGFANGVDIYEGDFSQAVKDLGRYIKEARY